MNKITIFEAYLLLSPIFIVSLIFFYIVYYYRNKESLGGMFLSIKNFSVYIEKNRLKLDFTVLVLFLILVVLLFLSFVGKNIFGFEEAIGGIRHRNNILYYLGFYFLIFIINIFKIIKDSRENEPWIGQWRDFFGITLDLSFTWSGVIIALLTNFEKQWHSTIFISSIIIFIISIFTSVYQTRLRKLSFPVNLFVISFVLISTYYVYAFKLPNVPSDTSGNPLEVVVEHKITGIKIIIPYKDPSIVAWLNNAQLDEKYFYYEYISKKSVIDSAKQEAINAFMNDSIACIYNPTPKKENRFKVKISTDKIGAIFIHAN